MNKNNKIKTEKKEVKIPERQNDHVFSHAVHRRLSNWIAKKLYYTPVTPNMASWIGFIFCMIAAGMFAFGDYKFLVIGAILLELGNIFDMVDGDLARAKNMLSKYGHFLDSTLDGVYDFLVMIAITYGVWRVRPELHVWLLGAFSMYFYIEFFMASRFFILPYGLPHAEFKKSFGRLSNSKLYNLLFYARQHHMNLIAIFAIFNQFYILLWCWAVIGNIYWIAYVIKQHVVMRRALAQEEKGQSKGAKK